MFDELTALAMRTIREKITQEGAGISWVFPREIDRGDLATAVALSLAKQVKKNPREVAQLIADGLKDAPGVEKVEVAGAGYVNVWLEPGALLAELKKAEASVKPSNVRSEEAPTIIDYSGPNIAKPLGIHHILSTVIGQALVNLHRHVGANVIGWSYPGDWGTQFGKLAVAFAKWGDGKKASQYSIDELLALYVRFHKEAETHASLEDEGRAAFAKLEAGDAQLRAFWKDVVEISRKALAHLYEKLHVKLDVETGESFYEDKMAPILEEGKKKGVFKKGEGGALIVEFPEESNIPPYLLQKSDGSTLYATRDLAMIRYRLDTYHPKSIYYVVDVAQSLHFQQLFATVNQLKWDSSTHLEHVVFGRMRFADASMSTRKGTVLKMEEVLDEAVRKAEKVIEEHADTIQTDDRKELSEMMGIGAVVYCILSQNRKMDIVFDWDKMLSFEGNSAPYIQYTHARACSVLRKAGSEGDLSSVGRKNMTANERLLLRTLLLFPEVLKDGIETLMPHKLTNYLYQLCQDFNAFYNVDPILKADESDRSVRLALTARVAAVLKTGAEILTLRVPDRM